MHVTEIVSTVSQAVTWPIVVLLLLIFSAAGWLKKPIEQITQGLGGVYKEFSQFKKELNETQLNLTALVADIASVQGKVSTGVDNISQSIGKQLDTMAGQIKMLESNMESRLKVMADEVAELNTTTQNIDDSSEIVREPAEAIAKIKDKWAEVIRNLKRLGDGQKADMRSPRELASSIASAGRNIKFTDEIARKVADLFGDFKSFTRRQQYADEWLTEFTLQGFLKSADEVLAAMG